MSILHGIPLHGKLDMSQFPARLHVLLAAKAPRGVVIRRGPSKNVALIHWDRRRDTFQLGQWLKGRIYERRSDLSPDGEYVIYFAMNGKWDSETKGSWTAISRAPYLRALALFAKGDCWHGGGLWTGNRTYWLNDGYGHCTLQDTTLVRRDEDFEPSEYFGGECLGVYYPRLFRDGWRLVERTNSAKWKHADAFEKPLDHGWSLRKTAHAEIDSPDGKGCYWDEHQIVHVESDRQIAGADWEWADVDAGRLVWASKGRLFCGQVTPDGLANEAELYDFNQMTFEAIQAPY